jgi:hypothetical protein
MGLLGTGVVSVALAAAMLLLAAWGLTAPSLVSLAMQRRASRRLATLLLEAAARPVSFELAMPPVEAS